MRRRDQMKKLEYMSQDEKQAHRLRWPAGQTPEGWAPIDRKEFLHRLFHGSYVIIEERWIDNVRVMLFFEFTRDNIAVTMDGRYFEFGCHHSYMHEKNLGRCYNRLRCSKCGRTIDVDSGD